ncbi:Ribophorin I-domain-containing protein, partial [Blyttiomyces helicus]
KATLVIDAALPGTISPYPKEVVQTSRQYMEYSGNAYFFTPYVVEKQKTTVRLPNAEVSKLIETPAPVKRTGKIIEYGPYPELAPYAEAELYVHYFDANAILVATSVERTFQLSHWGNNLAVKEDYELHHRGAKLKGQFSRVDFGMTARMHDQTNVVKELAFSLPPRASNVFFRDQIGNVSTSHFRPELARSALELRPRYPLYGGWRYTWQHGYDVPLEDFVKVDTKTGSYVLTVPFIAGLPNVTAEKVVLTIVLPEGAVNAQVHTPFNVDRVSNSKVYTYLDTTGRPTLHIEKYNVVDEFALPIQVSYDYALVNLFQKPIAVGVTALAILLLFSIFSRLDLSIIKDPKAEHALLVRGHSYTVQKIAYEELQALQTLETAFTSFKSTKDSAALKTATATAEFTLKSGWTKLSKIADATAGIGSFSPNLVRLVSLSTDRFAAVKVRHTEVAQFYAGVDPKAGADEKKRKALQTALDKHEADLARLNVQIKKLVKELEL